MKQWDDSIVDSARDAIGTFQVLALDVLKQRDSWKKHYWLVRKQLAEVKAKLASALTRVDYLDAKCKSLTDSNAKLVRETLAMVGDERVAAVEKARLAAVDSGLQLEKLRTELGLAAHERNNANALLRKVYQVNLSLRTTMGNLMEKRNTRKSIASELEQLSKGLALEAEHLRNE
jgi:hypothetical protein